MNRSLYKILGFSLVVLFVDQFIKLFLESKMVLYQSTALIENFFNITLVHNTGAAFSIFSGNTFLLILIGIATFIGVCIYIYKENILTNYYIFVYSLLLGGILGNLFDRIFYGHVIDYMNLKIFNYNFPIFNFADACIVISVLLVLINIIKEDLWKES